ncbi:MAG: methyltransferase domain-containing protein [Candidatus Hodarchaeota archaeon]
MALEESEDAFGQIFNDYFYERDGTGEIVERDDGYVDISCGGAFYFSQYRDWPEYEKAAMKFVKGKVLDIGCGAGRHSLFLQKKGFEILGIDASPLAIEVCKRRGLNNARVLSIADISADLGMFDTILMLGNNFCLVGTPDRGKKLLRELTAITADRGRIVAQTRDPYKTDKPEHFEYHASNRKQGKMSGQARIRIRYKKYATPWFDFLMTSREEMQAILDNTCWQITECIEGNEGIFVAIMDKI